MAKIVEFMLCIFYSNKKLKTKKRISRRFEEKFKEVKIQVSRKIKMLLRFTNKGAIQVKRLTNHFHQLHLLKLKLPHILSKSVGERVFSYIVNESIIRESEDILFSICF